jgi:hypothetical protein
MCETDFEVNIFNSQPVISLFEPAQMYI